MTDFLRTLHEADAVIQGKSAMNVPDLTELLVEVDELLSVVQSYRSDLADQLAESMEADLIDTPAGRVSRERKTTTSWKGGRDWRPDLAGAIVKAVAFSEVTGELNPEWQRVAQVTMAKAMKAMTTSPKIGGLLDFGLQPDEYRTVSPAGWTVKVSPVGSIL